MAIVSACTYDAQGRLVPPDPLDIGKARIRLDLDTDEVPTFDRGYTHVFVISAGGLTPDEARERASEKLRRFFDYAEFTSGYRKIEMSKTQGRIPCNNSVDITYEILYAVEDRVKARSHSPESPYAGYRRDRDAVARR